MSRITSNIPDSLRGLNDALISQKESPSFENSLSVANQIAGLFGVEADNEPKPFNDSRGKIKDHAGWFMEAQGFGDRRACYKIADTNSKNLDLKLYWVQKPSKRVISTIVALTPNFEDEPFYQKESVGIDFIIPKEANRIIVALSSNYTIRTIELEGSLTITQQEIFIKWTQGFDFENKIQLHQILWQSFDLQPLNKRFYQEVTRNFTELVQHLVGEKVFADHKHAALFTNRLIGRLIFCWFLRKKGIIADTHEYFITNDQKSTDYYKSKLEKLFFGILNTPIEDRSKFSTDHVNLFGVVKGEPNLFIADTETPFLNGGLFEPRPTDHFGENKITFPNDYFDRFYKFLNQYNFTTDESTSSFQQVAIDPEMLGRIFENLLAEQTEDTGEQARKAKGAFYTPREIVDYMCRESVRAYIAGKLPDDERKEHTLELLFDKKEHDFDNRNHRADLVTYKKDILQALDVVKVLDPACGSGAFPMGILQLILSLYERLETRFDPYKTKLSIIQNNLYGIDIEPMAVEIARLRVWLSLLVDEELNPKAKNMGVDPLPNLDFKFVCANSLIDLDQSGKVTLYGDDPDLENKLQAIRDAYFNTESVTKKKKLRSDYDKIVNTGEGLFGQSEKAKQLKTYRPFDTELSACFFNPQFMFGVNTFEVIVGNPPYFVYQGHSKNEIDEIKKIDIYKKAEGGKLNAFKLFLARGANLLSPKGVLGFIFQNSFLADNGSKKIRQFFINEQKILCIDSFPERDSVKKRVFEAVKMSVCIMFSVNEKLPEYSFPLNVWEDRDKLVGYSTTFGNRELSDYDPISLQIPSLHQNEKIIFKKFFSKKDVEKVKCFEGELNMTFHRKFFSKDSTSPKIIKGAQVQRYFLTDKMSQGELEYLNENDYLANNGGEKSKHHLNDRIALQGITGANDKVRIIATFVPKGLYVANSCNYLVGIPNGYTSKALLGILNSYLINWLFRKTSTNSNVNTYEISNLSFPRLNSTNPAYFKEIDSLVDQVLKAKAISPKNDTKNLEEKIDDLVYELYGLNEEEKGIIKNI